jgi:hypothetical protein
LFIHNRWQEGLVPQFGVSERSQSEIRRFFALVEQLRWQKGADGRYAFDIPVNNSSKDPQYLQLDSISMQEYLRQHGFVSEELLWYLNYCCRDDYGAGLSIISAWAGLHYFAGRKGRAANAESSQVLTWPQGNGRLVQHLQQFSKGKINTHCLVYKVTPEGDQVLVDYFEAATNQTKRIIARHCILATPQFITQRLLPAGSYDHDFTYSPWLVANITLDYLPEAHGLPLCWDNVIYKGRSLGYVNAQQQRLAQKAPAKQVITYYLPLDHLPPAAARQYALGLAHPHWVKLITDDLEQAHPGIHALIKNIDIWVWGHGMIRPHTGFITGPARMAAQESGYPHIFFAHSDLSGISIFEEAFYHGNRAAQAVLAAIA